MFESLSQRLSDVFDKLKKRGALSEADVEEAMTIIEFMQADADRPLCLPER